MYFNITNNYYETKFPKLAKLDWSKCNDVNSIEIDVLALQIEDHIYIRRYK